MTRRRGPASFFPDPVQGMRMRLFEVVEKCREKCRKL